MCLFDFVFTVSHVSHLKYLAASIYSSGHLPARMISINACFGRCLRFRCNRRIAIRVRLGISSHFFLLSCSCCGYPGSGSCSNISASRSRSSALSMSSPMSLSPSIPSIGVLVSLGSLSSSRLPTKAVEHRPSSLESSAMPFNRSAKLGSSVCSMHFGIPFSSSSYDHSYSCSSTVLLLEKNDKSPLHLRSSSARWLHLSL